MVPAERVHDARLQLASQGLPQGKNSSFELISKDPGFGVSQFMENARYQYALESELARTISSLQAVEAARVHLAIAAAIGVRARSPAGQRLGAAAAARRPPPGAEQVSAIVHLVASSIPELDSDKVTVVDQQGRLLSSPKTGEAAVAAEQFEAAHRIEDTYIQHIEQLIAPLVGDGRVRAQVTVDLDHGRQRGGAASSTSPTAPWCAASRARRDHARGGAGSGGVPGALTNQPPAGGHVAAGRRTEAGGTRRPRRGGTAASDAAAAAADGAPARRRGGRAAATPPRTAPSRAPATTRSIAP